MYGMNQGLRAVRTITKGWMSFMWTSPISCTGASLARKEPFCYIVQRETFFSGYNLLLYMYNIVYIYIRLLIKATNVDLLIAYLLAYPLTCLSIYLLIYLPAFLLTCLSICLPTYLLTFLLAYLLTCLFTYLFTCLLIYLGLLAYLFTCLLTYSLIYLLVYLLTCPSLKCS